jgi:hypothetical protein
MTTQRTLAIGLGLTFLLAALLAMAPAQPAQAAVTTKCEMKFNMHEWSAIYKVARGHATITCDNGEKSDVALELKAGGFTAGKSQIEGTGKFSEVSGIGDLLGSYLTGDVAAGAVKAAGATVMTKGEVSLALTSHGRGWDAGVSFGKFTISAATPR